VQTVAERPRTQRLQQVRPGAADTRPRRERVACLDNLKLLLVAVIIAGHGALAYGDLENAWPTRTSAGPAGGRQRCRPVGSGDPGRPVRYGTVLPDLRLVTPGSVERKGPRTFARDRLLRLGVPLLLWTLVLWPGTIWASHLAASDMYSFWTEVTNDEPVLDTGPMWFVAVLLVYSLNYAGGRSWRQRRG
jgi:Acyltransferase family